MNPYLFLGHIFVSSQAICLKGFLHAMSNDTNGSSSSSSSSSRQQALMWAACLIATELVSGFLVSWNWSILCRLACVCI
jgi:hypothetical protein